MAKKTWVGEPKTSQIVWRPCVHAKGGRFPNGLLLPIVRTLYDKTMRGVHFGSIGMARVSDTKHGVPCVKSPDSLITLGLGLEARRTALHMAKMAAGW